MTIEARADQVIQEIRRLGVSLRTALRGGRRILVASPARRVTPKVRSLVQSQFQRLVSHVHADEVRRQLSAEQRAVENVQRRLRHAGRAAHVVVVRSEEEVQNALTAGEIPVTLTALEELTASSTTVLRDAVMIARRFRGVIECTQQPRAVAG